MTSIAALGTNVSLAPTTLHFTEPTFIKAEISFFLASTMNLREQVDARSMSATKALFFFFFVAQFTRLFSARTAFGQTIAAGFSLTDAAVTHTRSAHDLEDQTVTIAFVIIFITLHA